MSPVDMAKDGAGQLYLKGVISTAPYVRVVSTRLPEGGYLEYASTASRISRALTSLASRIGAWQTLKIALYERKQLSLDARRAKELLSSYEADSGWITLSSPESILLAHSLIKKGVKIRVTVWDAPEHILVSQNISRTTTERLMNLFTEVLRGAKSVSVISYNMQERYQSQLDITAIVIRPVAALLQEEKKTVSHRRTLRIVFAGSLYAKVEWNALLKSLAAQQWRIADRKVVVYYLGAFPLRGAHFDRRVKRLGQMPTAEAAALCRKCDVAYLPYWISSDNALVASTSFPSKLAFYISNGLPVFNHGPKTSETTRIMHDFEIGVSCHSLDVDKIAAALEVLARPEKLIDIQQEIRNLILNELSAQSVEKHFIEFISK